VDAELAEVIVGDVDHAGRARRGGEPRDAAARHLQHRPLDAPVAQHGAGPIGAGSRRHHFVPTVTRSVV
jgi:hypothetical protein